MSLYLILNKLAIFFMFKTDRITLYKIIAITCTVILCLVQLVHIRNIYKLENEVYAFDEKKIIKLGYEESITNDKLYPGAVKIIDSILYKHFEVLENDSARKSPGFKTLCAKICDTLFTKLQQNNNIDSLLKTIKTRHKITTDIVYGLFIEQIAIAREPNQYYTIFDKSDNGFNFTVPFIKNTGAKIGGTLNLYNPQTLITTLKVSSFTGHTYKMNSALYCDRTDRLQKIIYRTLPQTLLSIFSILAVLTIFFLTFANWVKQKKLSEMKTDFINTITHEFQTPLTTIIIANKTMEQENITLQNQKLASLNNILKRQTERLSVLIKQVTQTSGEKPINLILHEHSIIELIEDVVEDYQLNILNTDAVVEFINEAKNDVALLDKLHFTSIILNIINNGIKYNHKNHKQITILLKNEADNTITLVIKDNGEGMSKKVKRKMFYRFYRNPSLVSNNEPGLGLGLYYTKQCLDAHGWKFEVQTKEQVGTEFIIYIPAVIKHNATNK
jgi:two-component system, OmpR family, phosphate regulon sensor histidine kinase PhoR